MTLERLSAYLLPTLDRTLGRGNFWLAQTTTKVPELDSVQLLAPAARCQCASPHTLLAEPGQAWMAPASCIPCTPEATPAALDPQIFTGVPYHAERAPSMEVALGTTCNADAGDCQGRVALRRCIQARESAGHKVSTATSELDWRENVVDLRDTCSASCAHGRRGWREWRSPLVQRRASAP